MCEGVMKMRHATKEENEAVDNYLKEHSEPTGTIRAEKGFALTGWVCPLCGRALSPWTSMCPCYLENAQITCTTDGTSPVPQYKPQPNGWQYTWPSEVSVKTGANVLDGDIDG